VSAAANASPADVVTAGAPIGARDALLLIWEAAEEVREAQAAVTAKVNDRNALIVEAVDRFGVSHRQVARAAGLTVGRIHDVLAGQ
jgi:hypothetical protein